MHPVVERVTDRITERSRGLREAYLARILERPAFRKAHADQLAHFRAADAVP